MVTLAAKLDTTEPTTKQPSLLGTLFALLADLYEREPVKDLDGQLCSAFERCVAFVRRPQRETVEVRQLNNGPTSFFGQLRGEHRVLFLRDIRANCNEQGFLLKRLMKFSEFLASESAGLLNFTRLRYPPLKSMECRRISADLGILYFPPHGTSAQVVETNNNNNQACKLKFCQVLLLIFNDGALRVRFCPDFREWGASFEVLSESLGMARFL